MADTLSAIARTDPLVQVDHVWVVDLDRYRGDCHANSRRSAKDIATDVT